MQDSKENEYYKSSELSLCATLLYFNYKIEHIERENQKSTFVFKRDKKIDKYIQGFWNNELSVNPKTFFICLKEIKNRIYNT